MTAPPAPSRPADALPLVCPACRAPLRPTGAAALHCDACGADFPRRAEVPVLLNEDEWRHCRAHLDEEVVARAAYAQARRSAPLTVRYFDWWVGRMLEEIPSALEGLFVELMCGGAEVSRRLPSRFVA